MAPKTTKRSASKPAQAPAKRERPADPNMEKCQAVEAALEAADAGVLPKVVATMLAKLQAHTLLVPKADRNKHQASVVNMTAETLVAIESFMGQAIEQAQAKVDGADADKVARDAAVVAKNAELETLEAAVKEQESELVQTSAALEEANTAMSEAKIAQEAGDRALHELRARAERITDAIDKAFVPLKERSGDVDETPLLKSIVAVGKEHEFDSGMMTAVPVALAKEVSARSGFDNMVLTQLETAMREKVSESQKLVDEAAATASKHASAVDEAKAMASVASEKKAASIAGLKEAKASKTIGEEALVAAQQSASAFLSDLKSTGDALDECKAALETFRSGVKAYFGELRDLDPAILMTDGSPAKSPEASPVHSPGEAPVPVSTAE